MIFDLLLKLKLKNEVIYAPAQRSWPVACIAGCAAGREVTARGGRRVQGRPGAGAAGGCCGGSALAVQAAAPWPCRRRAPLRYRTPRRAVGCRRAPALVLHPPRWCCARRAGAAPAQVQAQAQRSCPAAPPPAALPPPAPPLPVLRGAESETKRRVATIAEMAPGTGVATDTCGRKPLLLSKRLLACVADCATAMLLLLLSRALGRGGAAPPTPPPGLQPASWGASPRTPAAESRSCRSACWPACYCCC